MPAFRYWTKSCRASSGCGTDVQSRPTQEVGRKRTTSARTVGGASSSSQFATPPRTTNRGAANSASSTKSGGAGSPSGATQRARWSCHPQRSLRLQCASSLLRTIRSCIDCLRGQHSRCLRSPTPLIHTMREWIAENFRSDPTRFASPRSTAMGRARPNGYAYHPSRKLTKPARLGRLPGTQSHLRK